MPTTPLGIRYPGSPETEPPNGPLQMANMAADVDQAITAVAAAQATLVSSKMRTGPVGGVAVTSNGTGHVTVTHGLGVVPEFCSVSFRTAGVFAYGYSVTAKTTTTFTYRVYYNDGVANSNSHTIDWFVAAI